MSETADNLGVPPIPPPDAADPTGLAGRARSRRLASGIATSLVSRGVAAIAPLILVPITLSYLGPDIYGLWMTIASVTSMVLWADFGLGNGLLTRLAPCYANRDWDTARRYVSTTYAVLIVTAAALISILLAVSTLAPWTSLFNVSDADLAPAARQIALICLSAMLINIPLSLIQRVQYACQQVAQSNLWQAGGSLAAVGFAASAVYAQASPALVVAAAVTGPLVVNTINSAFVYSRAERRIAPRPRSVDRRFARSLLQLGSQFFILSIVTSIALNADNLIVARTLGLTAVTDFSVPAKLFTALGMIVTLVNLPLWPAYGEALARGDLEWVRRTTRRMTLLSGGAVLVPSVGLIIGGDAIIAAWTGDVVSTPPLLLAGFAAWWFLLAITSPSFMVQNAAGMVRPQLLGWAGFLLLSVPLKWLAARELGIAGIPLAGTIVYMLCLWPAAVTAFRLVLSRSSTATTREPG